MDEEFKDSGVREINVTQLRYHHSSMTKATYCTLILKFSMFLVEILFKTFKLKKFLDLLFLSFYREVLSQTYRSLLTSLLEKMK